MTWHQESGTGIRGPGSRTQDCALQRFLPISVCWVCHFTGSHKNRITVTLRVRFTTQHSMHSIFKENVTIGIFTICL